MNKSDTVVMRHILEIRFAKRQFSFRDFCGELADYLVAKTKYDKIKFNDFRIDVVSNDLKEAFFLSWENFGFQIDASVEFDQFNEYTKKLIETINGFEKYQKDHIYRIGTRTSILFHRKGESLEGLKQKFKNKMASNSQELEKAIGLKISDLGYSYDLESKDGKSHLLMGPVSRLEAIQKFFGKSSYNDVFKHDHGIYYEIDLFQEKKDELEISQIEDIITKNVSDIKNGFENFVKYFYEES